jgi:hypothetical protein
MSVTVNTGSKQIWVSQENIDSGKCGSPQECAIAYAIKQYDAEVCYVAVRTNCLTITRRKDDGRTIRQHWAVPRKAAMAIIAFDKGDEVKPFGFAAKLIDQVELPKVTAIERAHRREYKAKQRAMDLAAGIPRKKYGPRSRIAGV